jgi:hypothetical protein
LEKIEVAMVNAALKTMPIREAPAEGVVDNHGLPPNCTSCINSSRLWELIKKTFLAGEEYSAERH